MVGQHGFARALKWDALNEGRTESICTFQLKHSEATLKLWPHKFTLNYTVSLQSEGLQVKFEVLNCDECDFDFTALLHTYFNIASIDSVKIKGLRDLEYADKLKNNQKYYEDRVIIENISEEVDRNYFNVPGMVELFSSNANFKISSDFKDLVVWNPWIEKSKAMADFDNEEVNLNKISINSK
jgi:glucose-6-phosphate 1-epimerase